MEDTYVLVFALRGYFRKRAAVSLEPYGGGAFFDGLVGWFSLTSGDKTSATQAATGQRSPNNAGPHPPGVQDFTATSVCRRHAHCGGVCRRRATVVLLKENDAGVLLPLRELRSVSGSSGAGPPWR